MRSFNIYIFPLLFLLLFLRPSITSAQQDQQLVLKSINEQNGLSDNNVQCIYKDRNNFLWVGTQSGLNLIDGSDITIFKHDPENINSITDNDITAITGGNNSLIWIGTRRGLNSYERTSGKFTAYPLREMPAKNDLITALAVDDKGGLFVGSFNGIFFLDPKTKSISAIHLPEDKSVTTRSNNITGLAIDANGILWITSANGLWSYDKKTKRIVHEISATNDSFYSPFFSCLSVDHAGNIWIGTWDKGLKEFDPITKKIATYLYDAVPEIHSIAEMKQPDGNYVFWLNGNFSGFDPLKSVFFNFPVNANFSSLNQVESLYASKDNWLWIGTHNGLYFYNPAKVLFRHHLFQKAITGQGVALLEWENKMLVGGAGKNFLKLYSADLTESADFGAGFHSETLSCLSLTFAGADSVKAATNEGIADVGLFSGAIRFHNSFLKNTASGNYITNLLEDEQHAWWFFPWRQGIWIMDSSYRNVHQRFNNFITENGVPKPLVITDAVEDKNGNIWFADLDEGIIFYDRAADAFSKPFAKELGERNTITEIISYKGSCFSFSGTHIFQWNPDDLLLEKIEMPVEIDKAITSIAIDSSGILWAATQKGLLAYNLKSKVYKHFTTTDGLITNDMNGTLYCRKNGSMFFGSPEYLTTFQPGKILHSADEVPQIILTEVLANGRPVVFDTSKKMRFSNNLNTFIFKWAVTDYNNPLNNHYYYRLKGIDKEWRFAGNRGEIEFANLSAGSYTLLLNGANTNGVSANRILELNFEIALPFWKSWWFIVLLFLAVAGLFYLLYKYRLNQVLKIEKLRNKISLDLHDDIGSTLSSISILSEMALQQNQDSPSEMLNEIKEISISLMERMDDIVWSINPHKDSMESLFLRIKTFAAKLFEAKEINYRIHISDGIKDIHLPMEYRQHIYLIMKEAINNMVKYSSCTVAEIDVNYHSSRLFILIKDNGKGFDGGIIPTGNGLYSIRKRAAAMNAGLEIITDKNAGTAIRFFVKIK